MQRFGFRDDQWERIKDLLPGREGSVGVTTADNGLFAEAVLYRYRTGMPWRDLPERFGDGAKVHLRCRRGAGDWPLARRTEHQDPRPGRRAAGKTAVNPPRTNRSS